MVLSRRTLKIWHEQEKYEDRKESTTFPAAAKDISSMAESVESGEFFILNFEWKKTLAKNNLVHR